MKQLYSKTPKYNSKLILQKNPLRDLTPSVSHSKYKSISIEKNPLSLSNSRFIEIVRDLNMNETINEMQERTRRMNQQKASLELNSNLDTLRSGVLNTKFKHIPISLHKHHKSKLLQLLEANKELVQSETKNNKERMLENEIRKLKTQLKETKEYILSITNNINEQSKKIEDNSIDIEMMEHPTRFSVKRKQSTIVNTGHLNISQEKIPIDDNKQKEQKMSIILNKKSFSNLITELKAKKEALKPIISDINKQITKLQGELLEHYQTALFKGVDFRQEGLSTIIKLIWKQGFVVNRMFFPTYLDDKAIGFLLDIATKSIEFEQSKDHARALKEEHFKMLMSTQRNEIFSTSQQNFPKFQSAKSQKYMANIQDKILSKDSQLNFRKIKEMALKIDKSTQTKTKRILNQLFHEENKINKFEQDIQKKKDEELKRIVDEFLHNDYGKRYNVCIDTILGALFGKENQSKASFYYHQTKRNLEENLKASQFYYILNDLQKKTKTNLSYN